MNEIEDVDVNGDNESLEHDKSVIFSGALWELRINPETNPSTVDELVFESLGNLGSSTTPDFLDGMYALISAAENAQLSSYVENIEDAFATKKIFLPAPRNFTHTNPGGSFPSFTWDASLTATSYKVFRRCVNGYYPSCTSQHTEIGTTTSTSFTDFTVTENGPGQEDTYLYSVKAVNDLHTSPRSNTASMQAQPNSFKELTNDKPTVFSFGENYPNPFNPSTNISFDLPNNGTVRLEVFNILGQKVASLLNEFKLAGTHQVIFDAGSLSSGVYIARIQFQTEKGSKVLAEQKMQLIK